MKFKEWVWSIDKAILICLITLELLGALTILRLSYIMSIRFKTKYDMIFFLKHLIFICFSALEIFFFSYISSEKAKKICKYIFFIALFLNFLTIGIGTRINGVKRWIHLGVFSLQSSEFVKTLVVFPVTRFLLENKHQKNIILIGICAISTLLQPDLGMTFLTISSASVLIFLNGKNFKDYLKIISTAAIGLVLAGAFLAKYALNRIMIFFGKKEGFQISQSLKIFASSRLLGEDTNEIYIPDSHCDFIFAETVSGFGVMAGFVIIFIPIFLFLRIISTNNKISLENKMLTIGISSQFLIQSYFHILSNLGFLPTKGLNLPFVSFGGSAIMAHSISMGVLLGLLRKRLFL